MLAISSADREIVSAARTSLASGAMAAAAARTLSAWLGSARQIV